MTRELPIPDFFDPDRVGELWRVPYQERAAQARAWAREQGIRRAVEDEHPLALVLIDVQNTFCLPGFALYVGGTEGEGPVADNRRLCLFIYRNLHRITSITATLDTHRSLQVFHERFLVGPDGEHPAPMTQVSAADVKSGRWRFHDNAAPALGVTSEEGQRHLERYVESLERRGKYELTIWPYHAMLGGAGHALVPAVEEALFFHGIARETQPELVLKGEHPLTEAYSALGPEVQEGFEGAEKEGRKGDFLALVRRHEGVYVAGQAKSHCLAWTVADWLEELRAGAPEGIGRIRLLEDCTSPVVVPGAADFTAEADAAFRRFAEAGVALVRSDDPVVP